MAFLDWFRNKSAGVVAMAELTESRPVDLPDMHRVGYEFDIPYGGTQTPERARASMQARRQQMDELYQAYMACPWVSTCIDTVARLVTAGGLDLVPDEGDEEQTRPPQIQQIDDLMQFTNDREDIIQLLRSTVADLMTFGDGFIEIGRIGDLIAALWTLDTTTMTAEADEHGNVTGYLQDMERNLTCEFTPDEVIHVSLDSPRGGIYGVSPTQKLLVSVTRWLFQAACEKEFYRRGMPVRVAVDLGVGAAQKPGEVERWRQQWQAKILGPRNIGQPIVTMTGAAATAAQPPVKELGTDQLVQLMAGMDKSRDEIVSGMGLAPAMVGIIESGNLGGGTGEAQARQVHYGTVVPIQNLILEKLTFHLLRARGIEGWHFEFAEVDYRDSQVVENIRDTRVRNGLYTLNTGRAEIGEEPVDGGDDAVLVDRQNLVLWSDMNAMSKAMVASKAAPGLMAQNAGAPTDGEPADDTDNPTPQGKKLPPQAKDDSAGVAGDVRPAETHFRVLDEAWRRDFEAQRRKLNKALPKP